MTQQVEGISPLFAVLRRAEGEQLLALLEACARLAPANTDLERALISEPVVRVRTQQKGSPMPVTS